MHTVEIWTILDRDFSFFSRSGKILLLPVSISLRLISSCLRKISKQTRSCLQGSVYFCFSFLLLFFLLFGRLAKFFGVGFFKFLGCFLFFNFFLFLQNYFWCWGNFLCSDFSLFDFKIRILAFALAITSLFTLCICLIWCCYLVSVNWCTIYRSREGKGSIVWNRRKIVY